MMDGAWYWVVSRTFGAFGIKDHIDRLFHLNAARLICRTYPSHINSHRLPGGIKKFVAIQEGGNTCSAFARE